MPILVVQGDVEEPLVNQGGYVEAADRLHHVAGTPFVASRAQVSADHEGPPLSGGSAGYCGAWRRFLSRGQKAHDFLHQKRLVYSVEISDFTGKKPLMVAFEPQDDNANRQ